MYHRYPQLDSDIKRHNKLESRPVFVTDMTGKHLMVGGSFLHRVPPAEYVSHWYILFRKRRQEHVSATSLALLQALGLVVG
jgi:hypothetical protein